jgi:pyridoxine 5-phosphate synthase
MTSRPLRLGVNVDHVATLRNARGGWRPDPIRAAHAAVLAGADGITVHLREDRRHIRDEDVERLKRQLFAPLNLEMAATPAMVEIAARVRPHAACLVPERREERTTEGGLSLAATAHLRGTVEELKAEGIRVSLFVEPEPDILKAACDLGAPVVELNTGAYCEAVAADDGDRIAAQIARVREAARQGAALGLEVHAGHGLDFDTARAIATVPEIAELNIGHFILAEALFLGIDEAVRTMRAAMDAGRAEAAVP